MNQVQVRRLTGGLTLLAEELPRPVAAAQLLLPGGSATDPDGLEGAATVLCRLMRRGAGGRDTRALAEAFESLGVTFHAGAAQTSLSFSIAGLADDWHEAMGLLADVVLRPKMPEAELEPCRQLALQELQGLDDEPASKMRVELLRRFLPGAVGRPRQGSLEGLRALDSAAMEGCRRASIRPGGAVLAVAGGVPVEQVVARVEELFGEWSGQPAPRPTASMAAAATWTHVSQTTEQVHLGVSYADVPPDDPSSYHAAMAMEVLSGGMGARLFTEVREKRGLCYSVGASRATLPGLGWVTASAGTTTERSSETLEVMVGELRRLPGTVQPAEIERGHARLLAEVVMNEESTPSRAGRMAADYVRLGRVRTTSEMRAGISAVSAASLNEHLEARPPGALTVVTLGSDFAWPAGLAL